MRNQSKFRLIVALLMVFVLSLSAAVMLADDDEEEIAPLIDDGRVNAYDPAAPVAVYCVYRTEGEGAVMDRIALLSTHPDTLGSGILDVTVEDIDDIGYSEDEDTLISESDGYGLYRATDGSFYVVAPADFEGKIYTFNWSYGDLNC